MKTFILSLLLVCMAFSCRTVTKTNKEHDHTQLVRIDSVLIEHYYDLHDTIFVKVPVISTSNKECDSLCQIEVTKLLQTIETHKRQGEQAQGIYYDNDKNKLVIYQDISKQLSVYKNKEQDLFRTQEKEHTKIVKEPYIPKFVIFLSLFGVISILLGLFWIIRKIKNQ